MITMMIPSVLYFGGFLTISYSFPWCIPQASPSVSTTSLDASTVYVSVSPVFYFRICDSFVLFHVFCGHFSGKMSVALKKQNQEHNKIQETENCTYFCLYIDRDVLIKDHVLQRRLSTNFNDACIRCLMMLQLRQLILTFSSGPLV